MVTVYKVTCAKKQMHRMWNLRSLSGCNVDVKQDLQKVRVSRPLCRVIVYVIQFESKCVFIYMGMRPVLELEKEMKLSAMWKH